MKKKRDYMRRSLCKKLMISYFFCSVMPMSVFFMLCMNYNDMYSFYLYSFFQLFIYAPVAVCTVFLVYKAGINRFITKSLLLCVMYSLIPLLLMIIDYILGGVWVKIFKTKSLYMLPVAFLSYFVLTAFIALIHNMFIIYRKR